MQNKALPSERKCKTKWSLEDYQSVRDLISIACDYIEREGSSSKAQEAIRKDITERFPDASAKALEVFDRAVTIASEFIKNKGQQKRRSS